MVISSKIWTNISEKLLCDGVKKYIHEKQTAFYDMATKFNNIFSLVFSNKTREIKK